MTSLLTPVLLLLALGVFAWGFERYRSRFVKVDLAIALLLGGGLVALAVAPAIFDRIGTLLSIQRRPIAVAFLANVVLLVLVIYLATVVRETRTRITDLNRRLSVRQATATDGGADTVYVVIPAYNEEDNIESVVRSLPEHVHGHRVVPLVVSDGSRDRTAERADIGDAVVVEHHLNQGQGGALLTGFQVATDNDADVVVTMDGDGQHPAEELERLVGPVVRNEADFVVGSRHVGDDRTDNGPVRRVGIRAFTWLINVLTKASVTDCTNGYRAIRGSALGDLTLTEERFSAPELIIEARKAGLRIAEVPITVAARRSGESKKPSLGYAVGLTRTILVTWLR